MEYIKPEKKPSDSIRKGVMLESSERLQLTKTLDTAGLKCFDCPSCKTQFDGPKRPRKLKPFDEYLMEFSAVVPCSSHGLCMQNDVHANFRFHKLTRELHFTAKTFNRIGEIKMRLFLLLLLILTLTTPNVLAFRAGKYESDSGGLAICEPVEIKVCMDVGYNYTNLHYSKSNIFRQSEASEMVNQFFLLMTHQCDPYLKLLVCSVYAPICFPGTEYAKFFPPCRFICERVRKNCLPVIQKYDPNSKWPTLFECDQFPEYTETNQMCLHVTTPDDTQKNTLSSTSSPLTSSASSLAPVRVINNVVIPAQNSCQCSCVPPMVTITDRTNPLYDKVATGGVQDCAMSCHTPYFSKEKRILAESWITAWSVVCFAVTLITVSTFLIDTERFKYPERPVIFLSACYMFVSIGFLIRVVAGHEAVACSWNADHVLYKTTGPFLCSAVFLLIYFFGMAGALWWVVLSLTWFLAAGFKCCSESIANYSHYFHAASWLIPALKSITVLAMSSVDGDALSGICYVGNQDSRSLRGFVAIPLLVYLSLGGLFLFLGFLNMFRIRKTIRKDGKETITLEKLMGRIGLFSLLYMIPSAALVACYFYELHNAERWAQAHNCGSNNGSKCPYPAPEPEFAVFIVKYSMMLLIGVTNGVWICSGKTFTSWRQFYTRCYTCLRAPPSEDDAKVPKEVTSLSDHQHSVTSFVTSSNDLGRLDEGTPLSPHPPSNSAASSIENGGEFLKCHVMAARSSATPSDVKTGSEATRSRLSHEGVVTLNHPAMTSGERDHTTSAMTCCASGAGGESCDFYDHIQPLKNANHPWFVLCDQEGNPLIDEQSLGATFVETDQSGRIQHIHHHHHHHVAPECKCACHKPHGRQSVTKHSSKHHLRDQPKERNFRVTPPTNRNAHRS
uniref:Cifrz Frz5/8 frizzled receptor n=1 Tax=Phallusia mammillata TaxID=59560 RepID=A0A6F9DCK6_9ASCI|nr:Cifrz Frz5/8 frizzled receptor [Phallusia mammillata]